MDFLKKHIEKLFFGIAMLVLIGSVVWLSLKVSALSTGINTGRIRPPRGGAQDINQISGEQYDQALAKYAQPFLWTNAPADPFEPVTIQPVTVTTNQLVTPEPGGLPQLIRIFRVPFRLLFKAYSYDEAKAAAYNFQVNFRDFRKTFFVRAVGDEIKDSYENTGYKITKFERKITSIKDPTIGAKVDRDTSELTIQHEGEDPKILPLGREIEEQEPVVTIRCAESLQRREVRRGQRFDCDGKVYIVVDIKRDTVIIIDEKSQEEHIVSLQSAGE